MRFFSLFSLLLVSTLAFSQGHKDHIIKMNKDTLFVKVIRLDKKMNHVVCEYNGKKIKYGARDILELKHDTTFYETGLVRLKRSKQFVLLRRTVKGKLSLYEIGVRKTRLSWRRIVKDLSESSPTPWFGKVPMTIYFYKKENESRENYSKSWREKTEDCKTLNDKVRSKSASWSPSPKELVQFYNANCS
jgi:hypothetical protein